MGFTPVFDEMVATQTYTRRGHFSVITSGAIY